MGTTNSHAMFDYYMYDKNTHELSTWMPQKVRDDTFHLFNSPRADLHYDICAYYNMKPAIIFEITVPLISGLAVFIRCSI